jgi:hypothetical protein
MKKYANLVQDAITAAKEENWEKAIEINEEILARSEQDLGALNRLGLAYMQLNKPRKARQAFKKVLKRDKSNLIAKKHLKNLKEKNGANTAFSNAYFIEEPGKTKIIELHRLSQKDVLDKLKVGQLCNLLAKSKYISVETADENQYIGALPDDISYRLKKLMKRGNKYECLVHSFADNECRVHLRETKCSAKNKNLQSFPAGRLTSLPAIVDEEFLIEDDIPVETGEHDEDMDKSDEFQDTLEKIEKEENY